MAPWELPLSSVNDSRPHGTLVHPCSVPIPTLAPPELGTADLLLRPLAEGDGAALEPALNDPVVREMFGWPAADRSDGTAWVAAQRQLQVANGTMPTSHYVWCLTMAADGAVIGIVALRNVSFFDGAELEVFLVPERRGARFATQALDRVVDWAFDEFVPVFAFAGQEYVGVRLPRIRAMAKPHNTASIKMLRRTQLRDLGLLTGHNTRTDQPEQMHCFGLELRDHDARRAARADGSASG